MSWETIIGLETHVQLRTRSKMFCGCSTVFGAPPNTQVCPVCLGLPGALPAANGAAIGLAVRGALALGCTVHPKSVFARKNYFYPDLPKGYQISQFDQPLATNGSVRRAGETALSTRTEVKNINSFAFVEKALNVERDRQIALVESGGTVTQQTMLYDSKENSVRPQRSKEESHDYRYFPEPDLPPLVLTPEFVAEQQSELPELPGAKRDRFVASYGLSREHAAVVAATRAVADYFETVAKTSAEHQAAANWVMTEALADAKDHNDELRVSPAALSQIIGLVKGGTLSHQAAKRVFAEVAAKGGDPRSVAESLGLVQVGDTNVIAGWVTEVMAAHPSEVERYKKGEKKLLPFFVGQLMRASKGKADPKLAQRVLEEKLAP